MSPHIFPPWPCINVSVSLNTRLSCPSCSHYYIRAPYFLKCLGILLLSYCVSCYGVSTILNSHTVSPLSILHCVSCHGVSTQLYVHTVSPLSLLHCVSCHGISTQLYWTNPQALRAHGLALIYLYNCFDVSSIAMPGLRSKNLLKLCW